MESYPLSEAPKKTPAVWGTLSSPSPEDPLRAFARSPTSPEALEALAWGKIDPLLQDALLARPGGDEGAKTSWQIAQTIVTKVRLEGDKALRELGSRFDGWQGPWTQGSLAVPTREWESALDQITAAQRAALERAIAQIERFHATQKPRDTHVETSPGILCSRRFRPLSRVGIYVPGGHAPLPSSLLMSAVPARLAGCKHIIVCTPADASGHIHPAILAAARLTGVHQVFRSGGAQAIAAMAYGTGEIPKVDKIFGPGNSYVTAAKSLCAMDPQGAAIDMPAGPSEVMVVADKSARPEWIAADLLSQAEHGADSHVVLVLKDLSLYQPILSALAVQLLSLRDTPFLSSSIPLEKTARAFPSGPSAFERAQKSLHLGSVLYAPTDGECLEIINRYAPEHLILQVENARALSEQVDHAGSIFIGHYTPESLGDYASGTNHVLPTFGAARSYSGLGLEAFLKSVTIQEATAEGLRQLGPTVVELASLEGLMAHGTAVTLRLDHLELQERGGGYGKNLEPAETLNSKSIITSAIVSPGGRQSAEAFERAVKPLLRSAFLSIRGYESARSLVEKKTSQGTPKIFLDANENHQDPWGQTSGYNRYPDPQPINLLNRLARYYHIAPENLLLTAGADQGIDLLVRVFCEPASDSIVITPPTYGYYEVSAQVQGARTVKVPLVGENFQLDIPGICRGVREQGSKLVFVCSPNNPTGMGFPTEILLELAEEIRGKALLVVDEAYGEFSQRQTMTSLLTSSLAANPHLVVLRTLSKSFGLAGLRLGSLLASPELVRLMQKVRPPYPLSQASVEKAEEALPMLLALNTGIESIRGERDRLAQELARSPLVRRVYPSETNFLLVSFHNHRLVMDAWNKAQIIVRDRSQEESLEGCLRLSVGSAEENSALLKVLQTLENSPHVFA